MAFKPFVVSPRICISPTFFLLYINDVYSSSDKLTFYLFVDNTNILYAYKNLKALKQTANTELHKLLDWLTSNKLTLKHKNKSRIVLFRPHQNNQPEIFIFESDERRTFLWSAKRTIYNT